MRDFFTTRGQNWWKEVIEKEAYTRLTWRAKYGQAPSTVKTEVPKVQPTAKRVLPVINYPKYRKRKEQAPQLQVSASFKDLNARDMRPVTPQTFNLLYQGFSKEGKGRCEYLQRRKQKGPEEKFEYPLLSSWIYGWRLGDVVKEMRTPAHGRSRIVKDTFYKRNGVFDIPDETDRLL
ncbi:protein ATP6V1FNB-like [Protopterus annectens]|uniref:protein ATP6V1FNB-like n=1 Tax=Protopterus annectens TaxID=7888 RepID=UPI001CF974AA|nr:protein ATP6V1FNB-like [Protopterus annectens]